MRQLAKSDNASAVYLTETKELKTHMTATARAIVKKSRVDLEKLDVETVKDLTIRGADHLEKWKQLVARVRPILKTKTDDSKPKAPPSQASN